MSNLWHEVFDPIASRYDLLNRVLSLGMDQGWRRAILRYIPQNARVLDVACGTGDVLGLFPHGFGVDPSWNMLSIAKKKGYHQVVQGIGEGLPIKTESVDGVTVAFGVRNFEKPQQFFQEAARVLKEDGVLAILEFALPEQGFWRFSFAFYRRLIPLLGFLLASSWRAYQYLAQSIASFSRVNIFSLMEPYFAKEAHEIFLGGIVHLYVGRKR